MFQFRLLLAHPTELLLPLDFTESSLSTFIFLAAGDLDRNSDSPWPASSGELLPFLVDSTASSRCCSTYSILAYLFCHCSRRNAVVDEVRSAVISVTVETRQHSSSGLARCFNTFGVSH